MKQKEIGYFEIHLRSEMWEPEFSVSFAEHIVDLLTVIRHFCDGCKVV